jgi:DNA-binding transcriptional MerR regulator
MDKQTITMKELFHNDRRVHTFHSGRHDFIKKNANVLHKPIFTIKSSRACVEGLTYRKVNDWDAKDLISGSREDKKAGWRKFSISDVVKLKIISDLRKIGFSTEKIKSVIDKICNDYVTGYGANRKVKSRKRFLQLEYNILDCACGNKILLLVDEDEGVCFLPEWAVMQSHFYFDDASSPILMLPFFSYVQYIFTALKKDIRIEADPTVRQLFEQAHTEKERRILEIIKNNDYEEIKITKPNGDKFTVKAKVRQRGSFSEKDIKEAIKRKDYQNVTVTKVGGQITAIVREETFKV